MPRRELSTERNEDSRVFDYYPFNLYCRPFASICRRGNCTWRRIHLRFNVLDLLLGIREDSGKFWIRVGDRIEL